MKKVLKKILKCLLVAVVVCIVYYVICLVRSCFLVKDLTKAMEYDNFNQIEELTGEMFFQDYSFSEFKKEFINEYNCFRNNKTFTYNFSGIRPYWNYILFEYEISYPDSEWIVENGENTKEILNNIDNTTLDILRKQCATESYFEEIGNFEFPSFIILQENYKDWYGETHDKLIAVSEAINLKNIMNAVKQDMESNEKPKLEKQKAIIAYNIFTNKFETDGLFYYAARGFSSAQDTVFKFNEAYFNAAILISNQQMWIYSNENRVNCLFLNDDLVWLDDYDHSNESLKDKNIYFLCNNIKKDEILKALEEDGYFASDEELLFVKEGENSIEIVLRNNQYLWSDDIEKGEYFLENNLSKEEIIQYLSNDGFALYTDELD